MALLSPASQKILLEEIQDYLLLGEIHGVQENVLLVKEIVNLISERYPIEFVGFEYYNELESLFNKLPITKDKLLSHLLIASMRRDGRFSDTHLDVIERLVGEKIPIVCFDPPTLSNDWNQRDKGMAEIVMENKKKLGKPNGKAILICGNMHAKTEEFDFNDYHHVPFGSYLKNQLNVRLNYLSGEFFNFGYKQFDVFEPHKEQMWQDKKGQWYLDIPQAHAVKGINIDYGKIDSTA